MSATRGPSMPAPGFDEKPLARFAQRVYDLMVLDAWFVLVSLPWWVALVALAPDVSNAILFAATALSLGPALTGVLYALPRLDGETAPSTLFRRGLRQGWRQSLLLWAPVVAVAAFILVDIHLLSQRPEGVGLGWTIAFAALGIVGAPWAWLSQAIAAHFSFRTPDVARLAASYVLIRPLVAVGLLAMSLALVILTAWTFDWLLAFLGSIIGVVVISLTRPVFSHIESHFLADGDDPGDAPADPHAS
ncbi:hypothetical protein G7070_11115 [Propioniciclava coleopterorum]|uniref:Membrane protein YesL n=1 Tax=Propioniciclava coleopterorum TaxID=2714937 RepID=A0A6G7Y7F5_9ACTN|nr:hypothetical protein [Propioniciclava coleopterorum]QIK72723.1 hypothetical protein G7070_11115 [Propioniciclava coleopterorum]